MDLAVSIRSADTPFQHTRNALTEKNIAIIADQDEHDVDKALL